MRGCYSIIVYYWYGGHSKVAFSFSLSPLQCKKQRCSPEDLTLCEVSQFVQALDPAAGRVCGVSGNSGGEGKLLTCHGLVKVKTLKHRCALPAGCLPTLPAQLASSSSSDRVMTQVDKRALTLFKNLKKKNQDLITDYFFGTVGCVGDKGFKFRCSSELLRRYLSEFKVCRSAPRRNIYQEGIIFGVRGLVWILPRSSNWPYDVCLPLYSHSNSVKGVKQREIKHHD